MRVQVTSAGENSWDIQANSSFFTLQQGTSYTLNFSAKSETSSAARIIIQNNTYAENNITFLDSWSDYSWTFTAQEDELNLRIHFPNSGTFLFDDFRIMAYAPERPFDGLCIDPGTSPSVEFTSLKDLASFPIGAAIETLHGEFYTSDHYFFENDIRPNIAKQHFDILSVENTMKPDAVQPEEGKFVFDNGDEVVDFAEANNMDVHGHVLLWHAALPDWMKTYTGDYEQMMLNHIEGVLTHYKGKMLSWDVVNEAFTDGDGSTHRSESPWFTNIGSSYIEKAFAKAAEIDPDVDLYYNDYNLVWGGKKLDNVIAMVNDLKSKGVKIDGVGMQSHIGAIDPCTFRESMKRLVATGLKIRISELDITVKDVSDSKVLTAEMAQVQAKRYRDFVALYNEVVPPLQQGGLIFWGMADHDSWLKADDWPLLWDAGYNPKPALQGVADGLSGANGDYSGYEIKKKLQSITFETSSKAEVIQETISFDATASSLLAVTFTSNNESVLTIEGNVGTIHGTGTVTVTASQSGNANYESAASKQQTIVISTANQVITFELADAIEITEGTFELSASTTSGLAITFSSSNTDIVSISGTTATIHTVGNVSITANQAGNGSYEAAASVAKPIEISKSSQVIAFELVNEISITVSSFELSATSTSGLGVTFSSSNPNIISISGTSANIHTAGTVQIKASQSGDDKYLSTEQMRSITILDVEEVLSTEHQLMSVKLYPNPATQSLNVQWSDRLKIDDLTLFAIDGKKKELKVNTKGKSFVNINISDFANGLYILKTNSGETFRFFIRN